MYGYTEMLEAGAIIGAIIFISNLLVVLSCYWSVHCLSLVTCNRVSERDLDSAEYAKAGVTV